MRMMIKRYLGIFVVSVLIAGSTWAQLEQLQQTPQVTTQQHPDSGTEKKSHAENKTERANNSIVLDPLERSKATQNEPSHNRAERNNKGDEWNVWGWTLKVTDSLLVVFTFGLFVTGLIQVVVFIFQYCAFDKQASFMRQTVIEMKRGTRASEKAAVATQISADAAKRSADLLIDIEKAHVFVKYVNLLPITSAEKGYSIFIDIAFINRGKTLAVVKEIFAEPAVAAEIEPIPHYKRSVPSVGEVILKGAGASGKFNYAIDITNEDFDAIKNSDKWIFLCGFVRYEDIFGEEWIRGFGLRYYPHVREFVVYGGKHYNYSKCVDEVFSDENNETANVLAK